MIYVFFYLLKLFIYKIICKQVTNIREKKLLIFNVVKANFILWCFKKKVSLKKKEQ